MINKKGTTWKLLGPEIQATITNQKAAIALMAEKTSVIRRPLIEQDGKIMVLGVDEAAYKKAFKENTSTKTSPEVIRDFFYSVKDQDQLFQISC